MSNWIYIVVIKGKQKRMVLFIRIEVHYCILPNRCQGLSCQYTTRKKFIMVFLILKCNIRYMNFLGSQQYLRNFISTREKSVLVSFFQNEFYNAVFIFRFFMNLRRQNVTNVTVTYVTNFPVQSFCNYCIETIEHFG